MSDYTLHNYFRSSTSIRVRVALNLKGLDYNYQAYALLPNEHKSEAYLRLNPQGLVPALEIKDTAVLSQSLAIIEYLDEVHPEPSLLPSDALGRARVRALAQIIGCDIHPLNNLRILRKLKADFDADQKTVNAWFAQWVEEGFTALEQRLAEPETGQFCHGDAPSLADICVFAQVLNNARFNIDMTPFPKINAIHARCLKIDAFIRAMPDKQPDAV
ncbi:MAG: maleylacetoacetate isomerase [Robiginitomaculum sp.]|nr:MAG: maleylacetoacetate isomerase [Robiginitomaculum sp.]